MTELEMAVYEKADDVQYMMAELERHLHGIRYDPGGASAADVRDLTEIQECVGRAVCLAKQVSDRMQG